MDVRPSTLGRNLLAGTRLAIGGRVQAGSFHVSLGALLALYAVAYAIEVLLDLAAVGSGARFDPGALEGAALRVLALLAVLAPAQRRHRRVVRGHGGEVIPAQALDRDHRAGAQTRRRGADRVSVVHAAVAIDELQLRAAGRAGDRLGMEATVRRSFVFAEAP